MADLTLDDARRISAAAEAKATELATTVTITVVDSGGHVRTQSRMDGARFGTVMISTNKAFTAAAAGFPSKVLADLTQPGQPLFGLSDAAGGTDRHLRRRRAYRPGTRRSSAPSGLAAAASSRTRRSPTQARRRSESDEAPR